MSNEQPNNPLHGITLKQLVERLVAYYGWEQLGLIIEIGCFNYKPSVTSSLRFLRSTPWARAKVEKLYIAMQEEVEQPISNIQHQMNEELLADEQSQSDQDEIKLEQQSPSNIESNKPCRKPESKESQEPQVSQEPRKFKFEYRKPEVSAKDSLSNE